MEVDHVIFRDSRYFHRCSTVEVPVFGLECCCECVGATVGERSHFLIGASVDLTTRQLVSKSWTVAHVTGGGSGRCARPAEGSTPGDWRCGRSGSLLAQRPAAAPELPRSTDGATGSGPPSAKCGEWNGGHVRPG